MHPETAAPHPLPAAREIDADDAPADPSAGDVDDVPVVAWYAYVYDAAGMMVA